MNYKTPEIKLKKKDGGIMRTQISSSRDAANFFRQIFDAEQLEVREQCMAVFLNASNETIGFFLVSIGGITSTIVDKRLIFRAAIECGATGFILAHNHPSGSTKPSNDDLKLTSDLIRGGKILGIKMMDHIILTATEYTSFLDRNMMDEI